MAMNTVHSLEAGERSSVLAALTSSKILCTEVPVGLVVAMTLIPEAISFLIIDVSESDLATCLTDFLDSDGTVYGINNPDEPVETTGMMAALGLFLVHFDEDASSGNGLTQFHWRLDPKRGLRPA